MKINKFRFFYGLVILVISLLIINLDKMVEYSLAIESTLEGIKVIGYLGALWSLFILYKSILSKTKNQ